jgi:N-acetylglucosaminyl-diphospho-decaprenol L-rhamnosyltransferase
VTGTSTSPAKETIAVTGASPAAPAAGTFALPVDPALAVSVVVVSYNTAALLRNCLESIGQADDVSREVFVVDNASTDGSAALVANEFPAVRLVPNATNVGFTRANNQALRQARGRYLLLLNPDAELRPGALATLVAYLDSHPNVGVVGPRLYYPDGAVQSSRRRFPTLATGFVESTVLQSWMPRAGVLCRYYCEDLPDDRSHEVDWLIGACLLVRREAVAPIGLFDERFFMYSEETDWCRRIKLAGWSVVYNPEAVVIHHESRSAGQNPARRDIMFSDSKVEYYAKHFGAGWGRLLRLHLFGSFAWRYAEEGLKYLVGHKRTLRRKRLRELGEVLGAQARALVGGHA